MTSHSLRRSQSAATSTSSTAHCSLGTSLFASLHIPDFPAAALLRTTPVERPCAVIERRPGHEIEEKRRG